jgi:hypothetical protein
MLPGQRAGSTIYPRRYPLPPLAFSGQLWATLDTKKPQVLDFLGASGLGWASLDLNMVALHGLEPRTCGL